MQVLRVAAKVRWRSLETLKKAREVRSHSSFDGPDWLSASLGAGIGAGASAGWGTAVGAGIGAGLGIGVGAGINVGACA